MQALNTPKKTGFDCRVRLKTLLRAAVFCCLLFGFASSTAWADSIHFDAFFERHGVPMLWIDPASGLILEANPAALAFYGHDAALLKGMSIADINTLSTEQVAEERRLADGKIRTVEVHNHPYEREGKTLLLSSIHDITPSRNLDHGLWHYQQRLETLVASLVLLGVILVLAFVMKKRRKAEAEARRFKVISDNALYGNAVIDLKGRIIYVNSFLAERHGYTQSELIGQHVSVFHHSDQMDTVYSLLKKMQEQGQFPPTEIWHADRTGQAFPMLMSGMMMLDEQGKPAYMAAAAIDLTDVYQERKDYEASLVQAKEAAEAASLAKTEFLANMSHEIRTPLNAVIGLSELQLAENLPPDIRQRTQQIHRSGELLLGIVNDLLDFSRIEAGKMEAKVEAFRLDEVIKHLKTLFALPSSQKGLELILHLQPDLPEWYQGDMLRLTQVLTNLMANAIKFTEQGRVTLTIELDEPSPDQQQDQQVSLRFCIQDTGIGMTPKQQERLFQAFSQADTSITRRHGGTGLGLIISQKLVQLMGSEGIHLYSEAGVGSRFEFVLSLPLAEAPASALAIPLQISNPLANQQGVFCGQRVLVVEDHPINQQVVQSQLEQMGLQVTLADDGAQGVEKVRKESFDLVLMDIQMPVMDGYQATREIRQFNKNLPIIALTAAALVEDRNKALAAGMNDHLGKPLSSPQLFEHLKPWLKTQTIQTDHNTALPQPELANTPQRPVLPQKRSLLIVDDQPANIKVLASLLKDDYTIQVANKGQKALEIARSSSPPDLILLDILMPEMDGYAVCRELKNQAATSRIPVIFISALDEASDETKGLDLGAVDYISKPFHPDIVKSRIRNHMSLKVKTDLLENMSQVDGLTQVANRRHFDTTLNHEIKRHARIGKPLGLVMLDIDYFKPFNDHYGHGKGDECLISVATALQQVIHRPGDLFARYGGEEFVAILPETDASGVEKIAEAIRAAVEALEFEHEYSQVAGHVTVSLGAIAQTLTDETPESLLKKADTALYAAKGQGRNRVVMGD
ncbi:MAG: response regulator [Marinospirillum sp.]|uniref:response regulator n=1 Tax=Marinospirillum sp. TaxID=2183934 RepID=UPI0019DF68DC|nr:response regulator [Marinospirillum sp.]MBE0507391.1 response regulator [Marinospirillum sp.]